MADVIEVTKLPGIIAFDVDSLIDETLTNCTFYDNDSSPSTAQVQKSEKSPFHESDSGLSEISLSDLSGESPSSSWEMDMPMLDEVLDRMEAGPFLTGIAGINGDYSSQDDDLLKYLQNGVGLSEQIGPERTDGVMNVPETGTATQTGLQTRSRTVVMNREFEHHSNQVTGHSGSSVGRTSTMNNCVSRPTGQGSWCANTNSERNASKRHNHDSESDEECVTDVTDSDLSEDVHRRKPKGSIRVKQTGAKLPSRTDSQLAGNCNVTSVVLRIVKSGSDDNTDDDVKALEEKNRKNAEMARQNRLKKKAYVGNLEREVEDGRKRIDELESALQDAEEERDSFKREVEYLKSVLANQSALAGLLKNIPNAKGVTLSSSVSRKRVAELDHSYTPIKKRHHTQCPPSRSSGVCLHVDSDNVSLEFCHHCADMASGVITS